MEPFTNFNFTIYQFDMRFTAPTKFNFCHARSVYSLLCNALQVHPLTYGLIPYPVESSKIYFPKNESYRFYLTVVGNRDAEIRKIVSGLTDFDNWEKECPVFKNKIELYNFTQAEQPDWQHEAEILKNNKNLTLQFVTPLRIRRETKKGYFDQTYFNLDVFFERLFNHLIGLANLANTNNAKSEESQSPQPPDAEIIDNRLLWLDIPGKPALGGVLGIIELEGEFNDWLVPLVLGQYLHCGKNAAFGLGRYIIKESNSPEKVIFKPASTLTERVYNQENLLDAFHDVKENAGMPGVDGQSIEDFTLNLYENLSNAVHLLRENSYSSNTLMGLIVGGKENSRALAIPTVIDRIIQRALVNILYPSVDQLLEDCSYAYRKGFSRYQARRALERAYKDGYRYVLEADIDDFFDTVDWDILFTKLKALFPNELFIDWIVDWIRQSVVYESYKIKRSQGLPQGAVISPLLANLYLDEFDEAIQKEGFRLIRYADDFIVVCKTQKRAEEALTFVKQNLNTLSLTLNEEKTRITHFDSGFRYLGFLFCRSVSVEISKDDSAKEQNILQKDWEEKIAPNSWLAALKDKELKRIINPQKRSYQLINLHTDESVQQERKIIVYISEAFQKVTVKKLQLIVSEWDEVKGQYEEVNVVPIKQIKSVMVTGRSRFTVPALIACANNDIPVYLCRRNGEMITATLPLSEGRIWKNCSIQIRCNEDNEFVINFSRKIIQAKLNNSYAVLRRRISENLYQDLRQLKIFQRSCDNKNSVDGIRGIEGKAASGYFKIFTGLVDESWGFKQRLKHPAPDPVNAMLSFGYTLLYNHIATALYAAGLNPFLGIYHIPSDRYFALASDLQEEFRFLVDALVLTMLNEKIVKPGDFHGDSRVLFTNDFRKRYITLFEKKISSKFTNYNDGQKYSYRFFFDKQAEQLKQYIKGTLPEYEPLMIR